MRHSLIYFIGGFAAVLILGGVYMGYRSTHTKQVLSQVRGVYTEVVDTKDDMLYTAAHINDEQVAPGVIPEKYEIRREKHIFQTFNNCGPATLAMALSYGGIDVSQEDLGKSMRPYQVAGGDNDDKNVSLEEVAAKAESYGLHAYLRPNGSIETLKKLIANDIVVVTRTWLHVDDDIGHYRIIRGYDDTKKVIIQDDSYEGKNITYSYDDFNVLWIPYNYEYLVIVPEEKVMIVEEILGEDVDREMAWEHARVRIEDELSHDPESTHLLFALSRIYYYLGDYEKSIEYFNHVENSLSFRTLWYQIEPLYALYEAEQHDRLLSKIDHILSNNNRAFTELYLLRGRIYENRGMMQEARVEYEQAVKYNINDTKAQEARSRVGYQ